MLLGGLFDLPAFALLVFAGFLIGGTVAAMKRPDAPYTHGLLAGAAAALAAIAIAIAIRVAKGDDINAAVYAFNLAIAAGCGALGGLIVERRGGAA